MKKASSVTFLTVLYCAANVAHGRLTASLHPSLGECEKEFLTSRLDEVNAFGQKLEDDLKEECSISNFAMATTENEECTAKFVAERKDEVIAFFQPIFEELEQECPGSTTRTRRSPGYCSGFNCDGRFMERLQKLIDQGRNKRDAERRKESLIDQMKELFENWDPASSRDRRDVGEASIPQPKTITIDLDPCKHPWTSWICG